MDHSIVDTAMTSRKRKREEYKKIILLAAACVVHMVIGVVTWYHNNYFVKEPTRNWELERPTSKANASKISRGGFSGHIASNAVLRH